MTDGLQGERGGQVQSDVREGEPLQGGHAVHEGHVVQIRCDEVGGVFDGCHFSPPGVLFQVIFEISLEKNNLKRFGWDCAGF